MKKNRQKTSFKRYGFGKYMVCGLAVIVMLLSGCSGKVVSHTDKDLSVPPSVSMEPEVTEEPGTEGNNENEDSNLVDNPLNNDGNDSEVTGETVENNRMAAIKAVDIVKEMKIGWNLGNTLESYKDDLFKGEPAYKFETAWGNPRVTQELIDAVIDKGFNVIRIPVTWKNHIIDERDYMIIDTWMDRVQEVVDYAYNKGVYVIINTHHEDWYSSYYDNYDAAKVKFIAVWKQIAERFEDYDEHLIFEAMNEPRKLNSKVEWTGDNEGFAVVNWLNRDFVDTIRSSGGNNKYRILMLNGYAANGFEGLKHLEAVDDDQVIMSVHAYVPYDFALNINGRSDWNDDKKDINVIMKTIDTKFVSKGIPVVMGEFGAMNKDNEEERIRWVQYYIGKAKEIGVPCFWWDNGSFDGNGETFGLLDRRTYEWRYEKLLDAMMQAVE